MREKSKKEINGKK